MQCLKRLVEEARADEQIVVSLWKHEMQRLYRDTLCRHADIQWFDENMNNTISEVRVMILYLSFTVYTVSTAFMYGVRLCYQIWPDLKENLHNFFVTFPVDAKSYIRPVTSMSKKEIKVSVNRNANAVC